MHSTIKEAAQEAFETVSNDTKFVRLTTITTIIHSIIFLLYVSFNVYRVIAQAEWSETSFSGILTTFGDIFTVSNISLLIGLWLLLAIGYILLPPIWEASLIVYTASENKRGSRSLAKWLTHFFPMFEFNGIITWFTPIIFIIFLSRFWMLDLLDNALILVVIWLRWLIVLMVSIFLPFTRFFIVLENMKPFDAMKQSMNLALQNFGIVIRATILQYVLSTRFIINILLFLGLPLIILYTATQFDISNSWPVTTIVIVVSVLMWLLTAYINGIIEAFFIALRYRLFAQLKW